jgi:hypothetical protein
MFTADNPMDLREITPLLTAFGPVAALIIVCDYILKEHQKSALFNFFLRVAQIGSRPLSFAFYGLVVVVASSTLLTLGIISINGFIEVLTKQSERPTGLREASAAIVIAIVFKILVLDYVLALKSFVLLRLLRVHVDTQRGPRRVLGTIPGMIAVFLDFFVTVMLTERALHWWQIFQTKHETSIPRGVAEALGFFDSINFMAKDTVQNSFYALNGTLIMYVALGFSAAARGTVAYLNIKGITDNIFKIIAAFGAFFVLVVAISRHIAAR